MNIEPMTLSATRRPAGVKRGGKKTVREGMIPGVVYGPKIEPFPVSVVPKQLQAVLVTEYGPNNVFTLDVEGEQHLCMLKESQIDVVKRSMTHVDLYVVDPKQMITVEVPVQVVGRSAGEKLGGLLQIVARSIRLRCRVGDIPATVPHDVTELGLGDQVYVDEIAPPEGCEFLFRNRFPVLRVAARRGGKKGKA